MIAACNMRITTPSSVAEAVLSQFFALLNSEISIMQALLWDALLDSDYELKH